MQGSRPITIAAVGSGLIHLLVVALAALQLLLAPGIDRLLPRGSKPPPPEVTVTMPEILRPPAPLEAPAAPEVAPVEGGESQKARRTYIRTTHNDPEETTPTSAQFESDRNTTAASEVAAIGESPLPAQEGIDAPFVDFIDRDYVDGVLADDDTRGEGGREASAPSPAAVAALQPAVDSLGQPAEANGESPDAPEKGNDGPAMVAKTAPLASVEPTLEFPGDEVQPLTVEDPMLPEAPSEPLPDLDAVEPGKINREEPAALMRGQDLPAAQTRPSPRPAPAQPSPGDPNVSEDNVYQPHNRQTHYEGGIGRTGRSAVNAADTPLGRYGKTVTQVIGRKWHRYRLDKADFLDYATIKLQFQVDAAGNVQNLKILSNDANAIMTDFTLSAVLDADLPAIPPDVLALLDDGRFNITYHVIVY